MKYFEKMSTLGLKQVVFCHDRTTDLKAVIAIHSTVLGPSLGGCRMWPYNTEEDAIEDALKLSRGMTYKNAAAGLKIGGGKAVIIGDAEEDKREALFRAFGQFVNSLNGRYITAEDVGTSVQDMEYIKMETDFVTGLSNGSGDPSPFTALGTFEGIKISAKHKLKIDNLKGVKVAVQGLGHVGYYLCEMLHEEGAQLIVTDICQDRIDKVVSEFNARAVGTNEIFKVDVEVFAPCAMGAIVNDETIPGMKFQIIAGASNNQMLDEDKHSAALIEKDILYAPDFIINAGGAINVYFEAINDYDEVKVTHMAKNIYFTLDEVYRIAKEEDITTVAAATRLAERRMNIDRRLFINKKRD